MAKPYVTRPGDTLALISAKVYGKSTLWKDLVDDNPDLPLDPTLPLDGNIVLTVRKGFRPGPFPVKSKLVDWPFSSLEEEKQARARYSPPLPEKALPERKRIPWL